MIVVEPLLQAAGQPISRIRRIHYTIDGVANTDFGLLELTIGGRVLLIDNASDGETLRVVGDEWQDPFTEPMSPENREFVAQSGKWAAYDVSGDREFAGLIGDVLQGVEPITNPADKVVGVVLRTAGGEMLRLEVMGDELYLTEHRRVR